MPTANTPAGAAAATAPWLVAALAPGFDPGKAALTVTLTRIMYPFILLVSLAALVMGMLNARNVFGMPAMASSFFNLGSIVSGVLLGYWLDPHFGARAILGLAIGTLVGGTLQLVVQLPALRRAGHSFHPDFHWRDPGVRSILRLMGPSVIAASTTQLNVLVNSVFASQLGDGPTFWLTVAFRLMQLPLGVFGVALGTVALPLLARMAATGNTEAFRSELARGMRLTFLMTIPSSIGLMVLAEPIISVLYQHGRFGAHETAESAAALRFYAIGLCGYAALKVLVNAFYALERRRTPMLVSFLAVGLNLALNWTLTVRFNWGHRGLALSTACVATTNFLILYALMRSHLGRLESRAMLALLSKVALASAGVFAAVALLACSAPALAQTYQYPARYTAARPVQWFIDGGASITQGPTGNDFDNGWTFGTGVILRPDAPGPFALRFDLTYSRSDATSRFLALNEAATGTPIDYGTMQTVSGFVDGVLEAPFNSWLHFYGTGGAGLAWRRIELTQNGFYCDPFFCTPGFGANTLVASTDDTRFAWHAGAGVSFLLPRGQSWFVEARYERIETPQPTEFIPIRFGFRF